MKIEVNFDITSSKSYETSGTMKYFLNILKFTRNILIYLVISVNHKPIVLSNHLLTSSTTTDVVL